MWSWHWFYGFQVGFEWYQKDKNNKTFDYFIIDLGCLRIQHCTCCKRDGSNV